MNYGLDAFRNTIKMVTLSATVFCIKDVVSVYGLYKFFSKPQNTAYAEGCIRFCSHRNKYKAFVEIPGIGTNIMSTMFVFSRYASSYTCIHI